MFRSLAGAILVTGVAWLGAAPAFAQPTVEGHVSAGVANFIAPMAAAGVEHITPAGIGLGGGGFLVIVPGWALAGATGRVSLHTRSSGQFRFFVAAELAAIAESDCCGSSGYAIAVGVTRPLNDRSGIRFETRLFLPFQGQGALVMFQVGKTFRSRSSRDR